MALHGRRARLLLEYEKLINLEKRSDLIKIQPVDTIEGMPPENYVITFNCRGIAGLNEDKSPQYAEFHQVSMKLSSNFPNQEPYLKWITPIWHPNIEHKEPHHVCTNNVQNWFATKSLDDLIIKLCEMVQYRHYHAAWIAPFPLDKEAADWVVEYAEPNGLLGPEKPVDDSEILRRHVLRGGGKSAKSKPKKKGGIVFGGGRKTTERKNISDLTISNQGYTTQEEKVSAEQNVFAASAGTSMGETAEPVRKRGLTLGLKTKEVKCILCYESFTIPNTMNEEDVEIFCEKCRDFVNYSE